MTERLLVLASHAVAEYDDVRMFSDLGYDVFAPGGYEVPSRSGEGIRPALPDAPHHPELVALCEEQRVGDPGAAIDLAKANLHPDLIDWADAIIVHHFPERWIAWQWDRIRHKRVIWRTCGQSDPGLEDFMASFRHQGMQIVRYSPKEAEFFGKVGHFAGQDALIRFGKYLADYGPWIGDDVVVGNVTQNMVERGNACGLDFWREATDGLPVKPAGPGSERLRGGIGGLAYPAMLEYLRHLRAYLYTGTTPASYTLGLIEAMLSGVPVVSIGPEAWRGPADLFEGWDIATIPGVVLAGGDYEPNDPRWTRMLLQHFLGSEADAGYGRFDAKRFGEAQRDWAIHYFGVETVGRQWQDFLA